MHPVEQSAMLRGLIIARAWSIRRCQYWIHLQPSKILWEGVSACCRSLDQPTLCIVWQLILLTATQLQTKPIGTSPHLQQRPRTRDFIPMQLLSDCHSPKIDSLRTAHFSVNKRVVRGPSKLHGVLTAIDAAITIQFILLGRNARSLNPSSR
jgi:hypothetical protein